MIETATPGRSRDGLLRAATWTCLVAAVFVFAHGYFGITHDNLLYLVQALARLFPDIYLGDIYLAWGSQDRYTAFSPLYAWLIAHSGLAAANMTIVLAGLGLFLGASYVCVRSWVPEGVRGFAMLLIAASNGLYGAAFIFKMGEQFATPRPLVEAAVLLALALLFQGRRLAPLLIMGAGAALHPLVALTGFFFAWLYLLLEDRRWLWVLALGVAPLLGGLAGVRPFEQLLQSFDSEWLGSVLTGSQHVFVTRWNLYDWSLGIWDVSVLYMGSRLAQGRMRHVMRAAFWLAPACLGVSLIGADMLKNVLVTNLQVWRAMWLVHWVAVAALPWLLKELWAETSQGAKLVAALAVFGFFLRGLPAGLIASLVALAVFAGRGEVKMHPLLLRGALAALFAGGFVHWLANSMRVRDRLLDTSLRPELDFIVEALGRPFAVMAIAAAVALLVLRRGHLRTAAALSLAFVIAGAAAWDRRSPVKRYAEITPLGSHPFVKYVNPQQEVLWYEDPSAPWLLMQRKSYLTSAQASGQMFNRETAMQLRKRRLAMNAVEFQEQFCQFMNKGNRRDDACVEDVDLLVEACREARDLDFIVLESRRGDAALAKWTPPVEYADYRPVYYLYACEQLRRR